jgi:hypothetical protein
MRVPPAHATTEDLQRRASEIRGDVDRTLRQLEEQLQPDRLWRGASAQLRTSGVALALAAGRAVMRHPKPVVAVGAAVLLYALATRKRRARSYRHSDIAIVRPNRLGSFARGVMDAAQLVSQLRRGL